jgi:hypothetical protein
MKYLFFIGIFLIISISFPAMQLFAHVDGGVVWRYEASGTAITVAVDSTGVYAAGRDSIIEKRDLQTGSVIWKLESGVSPVDIATFRDGLYIVGAGWTVEKRNLVDGALVWTAFFKPSDNSTSPAGIIVDDSGLYIGGTFSPNQGLSNPETWDGGIWRIVKINRIDGGLIWEAVSNPSPKSDYVHSVAVDSTGLYVVGFDSSEGLPEWRIEKHNLNDGSTIWEQTSNPTKKDDIAFDVAVDGSGLYVTGQSYPDDDVQARLEKRDPQTGSLIWAVDSNPTPYGLHLGAAIDDYSNIVLGDHCVIVGGRDSINARNDWGYPDWRIEKRAKEDGSLIWVQTETRHGDINLLQDMALHGSDLYLVGQLGSWCIEKRNTGMPREPLISDFNTFYLKNPTRILFPATSANKPMGCGAADITDSASLGLLMSLTKQPIASTDSAPDIILSDGRYSPEKTEDIITAGEPLVNSLVKYAEDEQTPDADRAPLMCVEADGLYYFSLPDGTIVPDRYEYEDGGKNRENFAIEIFRDSTGRVTLVLYGFTQRGTLLAGEYLKSIYPDISSYPYRWMIVRWTDNNWDGFNDALDGDAFLVVAHG